VAAHLKPGQEGYCKLNAEADLAAKATAKRAEQSDDWTNRSIGAGDGAVSLVRQGPLPGSVHSIVLGDVRADIKKQFQLASITEWASHPSQGARWDSMTYDMDSTSAVLKKLTGAFHAKALTGNIPTSDILIRNFHTDSASGIPLRSVNCLLCKAQKETNSHLLQCPRNTGVERVRAKQADIIAQFEDELTDELHLTSFKDIIKSHSSETDWIPPDRMRSYRPAVVIGDRVLSEEWFLESWETLRLHDVKVATAISKIKHATPRTRWPHSLARALQSTLGISQHVAANWEQWYPGVHKHYTMADTTWWSDPSSLSNQCSYFTVSPEASAENATTTLENIANIAKAWEDIDPKSSTRIVLLLPEESADQNVIETAGGRMICRFESLPFHGASDMTARRQPNLEHTGRPWCIAIWETATVANNYPITNQLRLDVDKWHARTGHSKGGTDTITWNAPIYGKLPDHEWTHSLPEEWDCKPTPWRLAPYFKMPWLGGTGGILPLCPFETTHNSATKESNHHGVVPHDLIEDIALRLSEGDSHMSATEKIRSKAKRFAVNMAHAVAATTRHWIWKTRNKEHHEAISLNKELRWLSNHQRTTAPADFVRPENAIRAKKPKGSNRDTHFFRAEPTVPTTLWQEADSSTPIRPAPPRPPGGPT
jgi:hypothetical protein